MPISDETREDITGTMQDIAIELRMARNGLDIAEGDTSERGVRYSILAARRHLDQIDTLQRELEQLVAEAFAEPEPENPPETRQERPIRPAARRRTA